MKDGANVQERSLSILRGSVMSNNATESAKKCTANVYPVNRDKRLSLF